jgi:GDPmannose 4,6-dehydratase
MGKTCLISGITGQDGSYLSELLIEKGYEVHGIVRRASTINTVRIDHLEQKGLVTTHYGDLTDTNSIIRLLCKIKPDEIYNIASQSHVRVSFDIPEYTSQTTGIGVLKILESMRSLGMTNTKFYQASSSELFGISPPPQKEDTPFQPQSPYGIAKLFAYWTTKAYRTGYKMFACNGILFNHTSPRRGETFVEQKIVRAAVKIKLKLQDKIKLGNIEAKRDFGYSKDYCQAIYMIMQHKVADDFCVATGEYYSIRELAEEVFRQLGLNFYDYLVRDDIYYRPNEVPELLGDSTKIRTTLGWKPTVTFKELLDMMIQSVMAQELSKINSTKWTVR